MAGAGTRLFEAGAILTANQVNTYLMDQVVSRFANTTERDGSFGSVGQPSLSEGRLCYLDSTNKVYIYTGSAWEEIGSQIEAGEVGTTELATGAVTSDKILDGTIVDADINTSAAIDKTKISGTAITAADTGTVTSTMILDGTIVNADINASAAIDKTKISGTAITAADTGTVTSTMIADGTIVNGDINASAAIDKTKISGTAITAADTGTVTSTMILDGTIVNADINTAAAIALSKLASGTSAQVILANGSGVPTYTSISGDIAISNTGVATIQANSVALGTDTTGNYVADVVAGTGVTVTHTPGEGSSASIAIGQAVATSSSVTFAAVTAPLVGNASTASTLQTARTISISGDVSGSVSFNGSANVDISATIQPNSVALGTDTTGNYMSGLTAGTGLTVSHTAGEGSTATVALADYTINTTTSSVGYTLALTDRNNVVEVNTTSNVDVTIPTNASVAFPVGTTIAIANYNTGKVRIQPASGVTLRSTPGNYLRAQYSGAQLIQRAANEWYLFGDLSAT